MNLFSPFIKGFRYLRKRILNLFGVFSRNVAIDLGTANTLVYVPGLGIVLDEPSVVAIKTAGETRKIAAVGIQAKTMVGRTPMNMSVIRPLKDGVIADFEIAGEMVTYFIRKVQKNRHFLEPQVVICVPFGATPVERRTIKDSARNAGAKQVYLVEEPMAAAIGAGLDVTEAQGHMVVDIGGGTTEVAVISLGGIVNAQSCRVGGDKMDEAIINYVKKNFNILIGDTTSEEIKKTIGAAVYLGNMYSGGQKSLDDEEDNNSQGNSDSPDQMKIRGLDMVLGVPKEITIHARDIADSLKDAVDSIITSIKEVLEHTPAQLAADLVLNGITLTGGGALLRNLAYVVEKHTHLKTYLADNPQNCVVLGCGKILEELESLKKVVS